MNYFEIRRTERQKRNRQIAACVFWFVALVVLLGLAGESDRKSMETVKSHPVQEKLSPKAEKIKAVLEAHGSPDAEPIAKAIEKSKRPKLMTALVLQESGGTLSAQGLAGELGCAQVIPAYHGPVPTMDADGQIRQAERILDDLLSSTKPVGRIREALARYNGGDNPSRQSWRYADKVIQRIAMVRL